MKATLYLFILALSLAACTQAKIEKYSSLVDRATYIEINFSESDKTIVLNNNQLHTFKDILRRNIKPKSQRKFTADIHVVLYEKESRLGNLLIINSTTNPFVNFSSDKVDFGFQLTYGIGQFLDELKSQTFRN